MKGLNLHLKAVERISAVSAVNVGTIGRHVLIFVRVTSKDGAHYLIYTPCDSVLFVAVKDCIVWMPFAAVFFVPARSQNHRCEVSGTSGLPHAVSLTSSASSSYIVYQNYGKQE